MSDLTPERTEQWKRTDDDGYEQTAYVEVQARYGIPVVEVSYDLLATMLCALGYTLAATDDEASGEGSE